MANRITKSDLQYDYHWTAFGSDNPKVSGPPDNTLLNRSEGYEMLYFINKCADLWDWPANEKQGCLRLEKIIKEKVPSNIHSQSRIKQWIEANYKQI